MGPWLMRGDCLEMMKQIPDGVVDLVLADPPYGTTQCKWDAVIPFAPMWAQLRRVARQDAAIVMTASQPFTSALIMSNPRMFKYCWVWEKDRASNFFAAKFQPLNNTEDVAVFSTGGCNNGTKNPAPYNPQGVVAVNVDRVNGGNVGGLVGQSHGGMGPGEKYKQTRSGYPLKILKYKGAKDTQHPTQKPVALMEYMIKTYTRPGALVLDFTMGSGTTGEACNNLGRCFIGIEQDEKYFKIAQERLL